MNESAKNSPPHLSNWMDRVIWFSLEKRIIVFVMILLIVFWGAMVAPFDWRLGGLPRYPVPVDAIPDIGENQQIVFTEWPGRSPQDIEDQITYPLTAALLGIPGVKTIRGYSMFGFSNIYIIFQDKIDFYWSRTRVLEKLNSLPAGTLPPGVQPALGPDATALGQVFWYVLEGRDESGRPSGGWDLHELRTLQDWYVRYALLAVDGVAEVASVGGFVQEYQIDVDPNLMRIYNVKLEDVVRAAQRANIDVSARTIEINKVEYVIRGLGFVENLEDLQHALIKVQDDVPVFIRNVANVAYGPAARRGALDKGGAEAVGGVIVARHGANPLAVIKGVKEKIEEIAPGLPQRTLLDGTVSHVAVVPFYDRSHLIHETLGTLNDAIYEEILVAIVVIILAVMHLESALLISAVLPLAVLIGFIAMKLFGVDANLVSLSGIAIAIGTLDDMGIVICENILKHTQAAGAGDNRLKVVFRATREVGGAVLAAALATIVSFLPVIALEGPEGKLFRPLAFTKTFALAGSALVALTMLPPLAAMLFGSKQRKIKAPRWVLFEALIYLGLLVVFLVNWWIGLVVALIGAYRLLLYWLPQGFGKYINSINCGLVAVIVTILLARHWLPFGPEQGLLLNTLFVGGLIGGLLASFLILQRYYEQILFWCLGHKKIFLALPAAMLFFGVIVWTGFAPVYSWLPNFIKKTTAVTSIARQFPGLGKEFMPPLDEGSYLFMPVTMPHASIGEALDIVRKQDTAIQAIPEVELVVGKLGRAESPLDPAPTSMVETVINYKPKFISDRAGRPLSFKYSADEIDLFRSTTGIPLKAPDGLPYLVRGRFERDDENRLIADPNGKPFRLWRPALDPGLNPGRQAWRGIQEPDDIWQEIVEAANVPGTTRAPKLQPISARIVMLQSGIRAAMGVRVKGADLQTIEKTCGEIQKYLREVPSVASSSVIADRVIGKPYLEIDIDRQAIAQYAIDLQQVQDVVEVAIGGDQIMTTVEGRERYPVRVRYLRELRDDLESLGKILVPSANGTQIPLMQLADIRYTRGPEAIKSEDTFLVGYVLFDSKPGFAEVDVVEQARHYLKYKLESGELQLPEGVSYSFTGSYENHIRSENKLKVILPIVLLIIFVILYMQFNSVVTTLLVFSSIPVAWAGGFIMIWLYGQPWFLDFSLLGTNMRELFQIHPINLSVAVWVGFLALFGIAADDNIVMATYLEQRFAGREPETTEQIRRTTIEAAKRRIRPCLMTTATTILALLPVLTSTGRGSEIMVPMAIPSFGGLTFEVITMLTVPVIYCAIKEFQLNKRLNTAPHN
ncbi:efflux RND transporter permease subunit [Desulfoferrobacter suflitae]|uniref:efflux RND transporter permease subunit n=1 Tax=Desulfoferrobacter suflitae TaxID=2865782 RepID=UPI002164CA5B|nr:efflux RND transporter permease subunit [Desulfoferrobacter suflitae]MCK8600789.1 efflux RND transporter permease subunit [Desulfoferrobacter suflitae]